MLLTANSSFIIGPVAKLLGIIMNAIFWIQERIGFVNIGLSIILFTVIVYMLLMPFTVKQQKFSKLQSRMGPELAAIQKKYEGKNQDQAAMLKMNEETMAVYEKYGVSPTGSCLQLIIQMPILWALYRVIDNIPAYVESVKNMFMPLVQSLIDLPGVKEFMTAAAQSNGVRFSEMTSLTLIDVLYKFKPDNWTELADKFPDIADMVFSTQQKFDRMNYFFGLNIADSPAHIIQTALAAGTISLAIGAALIPLLSIVSQWLNTKMISAKQGNGSSQDSPADGSMKTMNTMNTVMILMSGMFCLTLPVGMGIYWIAGAVIRMLQQAVISWKMDRLDIDEYIKENLDKANKKRKEKGMPPIVNVDMTQNSNGGNINSRKAAEEEQKGKGQARGSVGTMPAKAGSIAEKAQMVKRYNEREAKEKSNQKEKFLNGENRNEAET